jgi:uncharacterized protein
LRGLVDYTKIVSQLTPEVIKKLTLAIEIGRWDNGDKLTQEQLETSMQAVMIWQAQQSKSDDSLNETTTPEPFVIGSNGELFTGKGEPHKIAQSEPVDLANLIIKHKV